MAAVARTLTFRPFFSSITGGLKQPTMAFAVPPACVDGTPDTKIPVAGFSNTHLFRVSSYLRSIQWPFPLISSQSSGMPVPLTMTSSLVSSALNVGVGRWPGWSRSLRRSIAPRVDRTRQRRHPRFPLHARRCSAFAVHRPAILHPMQHAPLPCPHCSHPTSRQDSRASVPLPSGIPRWLFQDLLSRPAILLVVISSFFFPCKKHFI